MKTDYTTNLSSRTEGKQSMKTELTVKMIERLEATGTEYSISQTLNTKG